MLLNFPLEKTQKELVVHAISKMNEEKALAFLKRIELAKDSVYSLVCWDEFKR